MFGGLNDGRDTPRTRALQWAVMLAFFLAAVVAEILTGR